MKLEELNAPKYYNLTESIDKFANDKERLALICEDESGNSTTRTYLQIQQEANRFANALKKLGLKPGDTIMMTLPKAFETYSIYIGALKMGLVISPGSEMLKANDLIYRAKHSGAKAVITFSNCTKPFEEICHVADSIKHFITIDSPNSFWLSYSDLIAGESCEFTTWATPQNHPAFLNYTSGTTGNPKGVVIHHGWAYAHKKIAATMWMDIRKTDIVWATAAPGWAKWNWSPLVSVLGSGATGFVYNGRFEPSKQLQLLAKYKINVLCCTPTEYRFMAKVPELNTYKLPHLRNAVSAGEPLNRKVIDTFKENFNILVRDGYGQTENSLMIGTLIGAKIKEGSMGLPTPGNIVDIVDDFGNAMPCGIVGNIAIHKTTPTLFKEYLHEPERTKAAFCGDWYLTGDRAKKDEDGYFWFEGRNDDIIISSGYTIGPFEVEDTLMRHPSVKECAVVASPDEIRGSIVKAFVVLKDESLGDANHVKTLQNFVKEMTAPYKYPRQIEFVSALPKTVSGKIRRIELREKEIEKK